MNSNGITPSDVLNVSISDRWFIDNNLLPQGAMDNILMWGYLSLKTVKQVEAHVDFNTRYVIYDLYLPSKVHHRYSYVIENIRTKSKLKMLKIWFYLVFYKMATDYHSFLDKCVKSYLGEHWKINVNIKDIKTWQAQNPK